MLRLIKLPFRLLGLAAEILRPPEPSTLGTRSNEEIDQILARAGSTSGHRNNGRGGPPKA